MKSRFLLILLLTGLLSSSMNGGIPSKGQTKPPFLDEILLSFETEEYFIRSNPGHYAYQSPNRNQGLRFRYSDKGFSVQKRDARENAEPWRIQVDLTDVAGFNITPTRSPIAVHARTNYLEFDYQDFTVFYLNSMDGMRQSLLIRNKAGVGNLVIRESVVARSLITRFHEASKSIEFNEPNSQALCRIHDLKVWDANGDPVPAELSLQDQSIVITVRDENAVYPITVDPLVSSWAVLGDQSNSKFGFSVAYARRLITHGPVGGVIIGAPNYETGVFDGGRVYVYYGTDPNPPQTPTRIFECREAYALFGLSVGSGDFNGDSVSDLVVGAPYYNAGGYYYAGAAFVWYADPGGSGLPGSLPPNVVLWTTANWSQYGSAHYTYYGYSVASSGRTTVLGAPADDLAVGGPGYNSNMGLVHVFYGDLPGLPTSPNWSRSGYQYDSFFGFCVARAGDVDRANSAADRDDLFVSAPLYDSSGYTDNGQVYIFHGSSSGISANPNQILNGEQSYSRFGWSVASAGDVNGPDADGINRDDVVIGSPLYDYSPGTDNGKAYVYRGTSSGLSSFPSWADVGSSGDQHGYSVAGGDLHEDGYSDIAIGAPYADTTLSDNGIIHFFFGPGLGWVGGFAGEYAGTHLGWSVCYGDKLAYSLYAGFIVGAPDYTYSGISGGSARIYYYQP